MDITAGEFALLLALFWGPVFFVAAILQWALLAPRRNRITWMLTALLLECVLAFGLWLSPLYRYAMDLDFLGALAIGSIPLQAAMLAAALVTLFVWALARRNPRPAPQT